jgi:ribonuclease-3
MDGQSVCRLLGYTFGKPDLLRQALTHRSYGVPHNERLEYLGDSILNCIIAYALYQRFPNLNEGELSRLRANLVNQQTLFELAQRLNLGEQMLLGEGELKSNGFRRPSILADALEALIAAVFLDSGFERTQEVIHTLYDSLLEEIDPNNPVKDAKTMLQELLQSKKLALPQYSVISTEGEAHQQFFRVECFIPELKIRASGSGTSRRSAEQDAAKQAYQLAINA